MFQQLLNQIEDLPVDIDEYLHETERRTVGIIPNTEKKIRRVRSKVFGQDQHQKKHDNMLKELSLMNRAFGIPAKPGLKLRLITATVRAL